VSKQHIRQNVMTRDKMTYSRSICQDSHRTSKNGVLRGYVWISMY